MAPLLNATDWWSVTELTPKPFSGEIIFVYLFIYIYTRIFYRKHAQVEELDDPTSITGNVHSAVS